MSIQTVKEYQDELIRRGSKYANKYNSFLSHMYDLAVSLRCTDFEINKVSNQLRYTLKIWEILKDVEDPLIAKICDYLIEYPSNFKSKETRFPTHQEVRKAKECCSPKTFNPEYSEKDDKYAVGLVDYIRSLYPDRYKDTPEAKKEGQLQRYRLHVENGEVYSYNVSKWIKREAAKILGGGFLDPVVELKKYAGKKLFDK
jgi:hypothetical protein